jgi:Na+-driven multidrug efflux pump
MGAGDGPYLAWAMLLTLAVFTPTALLIQPLGGGLTALWSVMALMMTVRVLTLWLRTRSGQWIVTGATR